MGRVHVWLALSLALALSHAARAGQQDPVSYFLESGGVVVGEAENFHDRAVGIDDTGWYLGPFTDPQSELLPEDGANPISNPRNNQYMQVAPDSGGVGGGPFNAPAIEYRMTITTTGVYRLYVRWEANGTNATVQGNSDSLFVNIKELGDGGGPVADWYQIASDATQTVDGNFATNPWDGLGGFEQDLATPGNVPMTWNIDTPGIYTLQFNEREDGAAIDAWVFQRDNLAAPTGTGPAQSLIVPEPASLLSLPLLGAAVLLRRRTRCLYSGSELLQPSVAT